MAQEIHRLRGGPHLYACIFLFLFLYHLMLYPQSPHLCMHTHVHPWAHVSFPYSIGKTAYLVSFGPGLHEVWVNGSTISRFCRVLPCQWSSPTCRQSEPPQTDSIQWAVIYLSTHLFFYSQIEEKTSTPEWVCKPIQHSTCIHGHRTLKAPHPVWSAQLTRVPPS